MQPENIINPKVSVLMPAYNGAKYIGAAIESILSQTFADFEFLIINDGSTDSTEHIIKQYNDPRIRLINNEKNLNLVASLNKGIEAARGEYIARQDQDDISLPGRIERQVRFMDNNPNIGICGTAIKFFGAKSFVEIFPEDNEAIKAEMFFKCPFAHPTVILRKKFFDKNNLRYEAAYNSAEDYELWTRSSKYMELANLTDVLFHYRIHPSQMGHVFSKTQVELTRKIQFNFLSNLNIDLSPDEADTYRYILGMFITPPSKEMIIKSEKLFQKLIAANKEKKYCRPDIFNKTVSKYFFWLCYRASEFGIWSWSFFISSELAGYSALTFSQKCKFLIRSILKLKVK
mgnify:CR=1 FL=1